MFKSKKKRTVKSKKAPSVEKHNHKDIEKYFLSVGESENLVFLESSLPSPDAAALPCATSSCKRISQNDLQSVKNESNHEVLILKSTDDIGEKNINTTSDDASKEKKQTQLRKTELTEFFHKEKFENIENATVCTEKDDFEIRGAVDEQQGIITKPLHKRQKSIENTQVAEIDKLSAESKSIQDHDVQQSIETENTSHRTVILEPNEDKKTKATSNNISKKKKQTLFRNSQMTDFFPVRRSNRKTFKSVMKEKHKNIEDAILCAKEDGFEIKEFPDKGRGVVTTKPLKRGDFVLEYHGELIDYAEAAERERLYAMKENTGCYMYYFRFKNKRYCIDATKESGRLGRLVNHSKKGNLKTQPIFLQDCPHLALFAGRDIEAGEELTYDYGDRSKKALEFHPWLAL